MAHSSFPAMRGFHHAVVASRLARHLCVSGAAALSWFSTVLAADQPQWGQAWTRNLVSDERGLPDTVDPKAGVNVRWVAKLGTESHSTPIVAGGRVYIGTNNGEPRDPKHVGDRGVLFCLNEADGSLVWQLVVPKREQDPYLDWPKSGISSTATVEGDRVYLVDNRGHVLCLDTQGLKNGNQGPFMGEGVYMTGTNSPAGPLEPGPLDADILWNFNLTDGAGIWSHDAAHSSILVHGDYLYVNSGTGVDNTHRKIRTPEAPSLVVLEKRTGRYVGRDQERIAPNIFHCTWSSPSLARLEGKETVLFAGGNGRLYGFEPLTPGEVASASALPSPLKKRWEYDPDPKAPKSEVHRFTSNRLESPSNIYGMPVVVGSRVYLAGGGDWFWGKNEAWLQCIEPRGSGVLGTNALVWSYALGRHTMATPPVAGGVVFATDSTRMLHAVDVETGKGLWSHELRGEIWASPLVADGKVYVGTRRGDFWIFKAGREKQVLAAVELGAPISSTATAANGVVYVSTMTHLYAFGVGKAGGNGL